MLEGNYVKRFLVQIMSLYTGRIQFKALTTLPMNIVIRLEFRGFEDKNWKSKTTNQKKHLSCNRQKICNIVVSET